MTDKEILASAVGGVPRDHHSQVSVCQRKLEPPARMTSPRCSDLLNDMADSGEVRSGYRIKRVASTTYKLISQAQNDRDSERGVENAQAASTAHKLTQA